MSDSLDILVIEDDEADFLLLQRHLRNNGVECTCLRVDEPRSLSEMLEDRCWDLILSDYRLPALDIRQALALVVERLPDAPVILLSGTVREEEVADLLRAGVDDFVNKDRLARLVPAVHRSVRDAKERRGRREALKALEKSEARFRGLLENLPRIAVQGYDAERRVIYWNQASERLYGYAEREALGCCLEDLIIPDDLRQQTVDAINGWLKTGVAVPAGELDLMRKDGSLVPVFSSRVMQNNSAGEPELYCIDVDMSDVKRAHERQRLSATVFESTTEGVFITDAGGDILEVNRAFTEITGYHRDDVVGRTPRLWQSGRHDESFYRDMWRVLNETGQWRGEIWNRRKDGQIYPEWLTISQVHDDSGSLSNYVAVFSDISSIKQSQQQLEHLAHHDALTSLPNRLLFNARLRHALKHAQRSGSQVAVIFLDLDRFKNINDSLGHPAGDQLLCQISEVLSKAVRLDDTVARIGGDEFIVLLESITDEHSAAVAAEKLLAAFSVPFDLGGQEIHMTTSMGISLYPRDGNDAATLLRNADAAMYRAKDRGRNTYEFYTLELTDNAIERVRLESNLRRALDRDEFHLVYQPQVDLAGGQIIGAEALIRWRHDELGMVSPELFIPVAEDCGVIHAIGEWVLRCACEQAKIWHDDGLEFGRVAVNLAGRQLQRGDLVGVVEKVLKETCLPPGRLELEVTENFIMRKAENAIDQLKALRALDVTLAIDDFGTGYSSLSYLKQLPIDKLKIDRSFVRDIPDDPDDMAISRAVIALGNSLQKTVIAEGVETREQAEFLRGCGCREGQGYLFSRPLEADDCRTLLARRIIPVPA